MRSRSKYNPQDRLFQAAKEKGYFSRAAFKLLEIDAKSKLLQPGQTVLDLGSAPGAWSQVACKMVGDSGRVIGVDLVALPTANRQKLPKHFIEIVGDATHPETALRIKHELDLLGKTQVDLILSDMSPKLTGIKVKDQADSLWLARQALALAEKWLKPGGKLVIKSFPGCDSDAFRETLNRAFQQVRHLNLDASRKTSREIYWVAVNPRRAHEND